MNPLLYQLSYAAIDAGVEDNNLTPVDKVGFESRGGILVAAPARNCRARLLLPPVQGGVQADR